MSMRKIFCVVCFPLLCLLLSYTKAFGGQEAECHEYTDPATSNKRCHVQYAFDTMLIEHDAEMSTGCFSGSSLLTSNYLATPELSDATRAYILNSDGKKCYIKYKNIGARKAVSVCNTEVGYASHDKPCSEVSSCRFSSSKDRDRVDFNYIGTTVGSDSEIKVNVYEDSLLKYFLLTVIVPGDCEKESKYYLINRSANLEKIGDLELVQLDNEEMAFSACSDSSLSNVVLISERLDGNEYSITELDVDYNIGGNKIIGVAGITGLTIGSFILGGIVFEGVRYIGTKIMIKTELFQNNKETNEDDINNDEDNTDASHNKKHGDNNDSDSGDEDEDEDDNFNDYNSTGSSTVTTMTSSVTTSDDSSTFSTYSNKE